MLLLSASAYFEYSAVALFAPVAARRAVFFEFFCAENLGKWKKSKDFFGFVPISGVFVTLLQGRGTTEFPIEASQAQR